MPTQDVTTIQGGYNQLLTDWVVGDDRIFFGNALLSVNPPSIPMVSGAPPAIAYNLTDCYFTVKSNPNDTDANAIFQVHVVAGPPASAGNIYADGSDPAFPTEVTTIALRVFSANYQPFVKAGATYYFDFRVFDINGATYTIASGRIQFIQNVTQTDVAGTPAAIPNNGHPVFRGFSFGPPTSGGPFITGDWYVNQGGFPGDPFGWYFTSDSNWVGIGVLGDVSGTTQPPVLPPTVTPTAIPRFLGWTVGPPTAGGPFYVGDFYRNLNPTPDSPSGWVCIVASSPGSPAVWVTDGIVGETP